MEAIPTKRIEEEGKKLLTDMYGKDVYKARQALIKHYKKVMGMLDEADGTSDRHLNAIVGSDYTPFILCGILVIVFAGGYFLGGL